jgi:hypothetical protein
MREIKFKGLYELFETEQKRWVIYGVGSKPILVRARWLAEDLQYTGLKDKNGKEIYEGDIYRQTWNGETIIGKIIYGNMARYWIEPYENYTIGEIKITGEVIGNIYENPELLSKVK